MLARLRADTDRTLYLFDVRDPEEYIAGHVPGALSAPGGQLVQATDQYAGTLNARIVVVDDKEVRAVMTASWLRQMGWARCSCMWREGTETACPTRLCSPRHRTMPPSPARIFPHCSRATGDRLRSVAQPPVCERPYCGELVCDPLAPQSGDPEDAAAPESCADIRGWCRGRALRSKKRAPSRRCRSAISPEAMRRGARRAAIDSGRAAHG